MTEWDWLVEKRPLDMLQYAEGWVSDRKLLLFCCACGFEGDKADPPSPHPSHFLRVMKFADHPEDRSLISEWIAGAAQHGFAKCAPEEPNQWAGQWIGNWNNEPYVSESCMASLFRELLGNPFRLVHVDPAWLTPEVRSVAAAAYDALVMNTNELDGTHLSILADALEEAGAAQALTRHLRGFVLCARCLGEGKSAYDWGYYPPPMETCPDCGGEGWISCPEPHVRGCWVVDSVLGKE